MRYFLPVCLFLLLPIVLAKHVKADEGNRDCRNENTIDVEQGEQLTLVSSVDPLERCYFVFTKNDNSDQCCYNENGFERDCTNSDKYKQRSNSECAEYDLTVDSTLTLTCNLTIKSVSEAHAGLYKIYCADHKPIQGCVVTVSGGETNKWGAGSIIGFLFFALLVVLAVG